MQALVVLLLVGAAASMRPMGMENLAMSGSDGSSASFTKLPEQGWNCTEACANTKWDRQKDCCERGLTCSHDIQKGTRTCEARLGAWCASDTGCGKQTGGPRADCVERTCCVPDLHTEGSCFPKDLSMSLLSQHVPPNGDRFFCCSRSSFEHDGWTLCGPKPSC